MTPCSILAAGLLLLTFDDAGYKGWLKHLPLFEHYGAHATFFAYGEFGTNEIAHLKAIAAAGHTIGLHTVHHRRADTAFGKDGGAAFWWNEVLPELEAARKAGLEIRNLAYPYNSHTPETDAFLAGKGFERFRAGVRDLAGYPTNGTSIVSVDRAFFPVADLPKHRVIEGVSIHRGTDIDDICRGIRRAAERDEVFALYSHDISASPSRNGMRTEWLEKILATARECGVPVRGFGELAPVDGGIAASMTGR